MIANLDDSCFKFLLTEKFDDGLEKFIILFDFVWFNVMFLVNFV